MKKILIFFLLFITSSASSVEKETTFNQKLFNKAQSDGKVVIISSWIKYCSSCAGQMKILKEAKNKHENTLLQFPNSNFLIFLF